MTEWYRLGGVEENNSWFVVILLVILVAALYFGFRGFGKKAPAGTTAVVSQETVSPTTPSPASAAANLNLVISSPQDGATVAAPVIQVAGKTAPLAEMTVNDKDIKADQNGNFSVNIDLDEGENIISVVANDTDGNYVEKDVTITLATNE